MFRLISMIVFFVFCSSPLLAQEAPGDAEPAEQSVAATTEVPSGDTSLSETEFLRGQLIISRAEAVLLKRAGAIEKHQALLNADPAYVESIRALSGLEQERLALEKKVLESYGFKVGEKVVDWGADEEGGFPFGKITDPPEPESESE